MKRIVFLFSFLILFLSMKPCSDEHSTIDHLIEETSNNKEHNHQKEDSGNACSISCTCNCCRISITTPSIIHFSFFKKTPIETSIFSLYQVNYRFDFLSGIWQPPQLIS